MQIVTTLRIAIDLNMHSHGVRLLNLSYAAELHAIAEAAGKIVAEGVVPQISRGHTRQQKEHRRSSPDNQQHQDRGDARQGESEAPGFLLVAGASRPKLCSLP